MGGMPSMSMGSSATGGTAASGDSGWGNGDWNINLAGSGQALQSASSLSPWLIAGLVAAAGVAWYVLRK
jgi:hypothetical protein